jgi:hypothetical protein
MATDTAQGERNWQRGGTIGDVAFTLSITKMRLVKGKQIEWPLGIVFGQFHLTAVNGLPSGDG